QQATPMLLLAMINVTPWEVLYLTTGPLFVYVCYGQIRRAWVIISAAVAFSIVCCWVWEVLNHAIYWHHPFNGPWSLVSAYSDLWHLPLVLALPAIASAITYYGLDALHRRLPQ